MRWCGQSISAMKLVFGELPGCISIKTTKYSVAYRKIAPVLYPKCLRPNRLMEVRQLQNVWGTFRGVGLCTRVSLFMRTLPLTCGVQEQFCKRVLSCHLYLGSRGQTEVTELATKAPLTIRPSVSWAPRKVLRKILSKSSVKERFKTYLDFRDNVKNMRNV